MTARGAVGIAGLVLHLLVGAFPYAASGLVAPLPGVVALYLVWTALLALAVRLWRAGREPLVLLVPVAAVAAWVAVVSLGDAFLGWTA